LAIVVAGFLPPEVALVLREYMFVIVLFPGIATARHWWVQ
jgi:hypothetical protein